jgi:hypothetical protein
MASRKEQKEKARQARLAAEAKARAEEARRRMMYRGGMVLAVLVVAAVIVVVIATKGSKPKGLSGASAPHLKLAPIASLGKLVSAGSPGSTGPEGIPVPAAPQLTGISTVAGGNTVDGVVSCLGQEQVAFHIHAHLTVFVNGAARQIPAGVGMDNPQAQSTPQGTFMASGSCFYFLHTHAADGIIHVESPVQRTYTLGNFFDVWGQPLSPNQVGPAKGKVTAFYNGQHYIGNPRNIPLNKHAQIQLDVGTPLVQPAKLTSFAQL